MLGDGLTSRSWIFRKQDQIGAEAFSLSSRQRPVLNCIGLPLKTPNPNPNPLLVVAQPLMSIRTNSSHYDLRVNGVKFADLPDGCRLRQANREMALRR